MSTQNHRNQTLLSRYFKNESESNVSCLYCFQNIHTHEDIFHYILHTSLLCGDCLKQLEEYKRVICIDELTIYVWYIYNTFLEGMIFQFKEGHDIALRNVFFYDAIPYLQHHYKNYTIVVLPSSKEKMIERSFLPVKEMLKGCKLEIIEPFYKSCNYKQSLQHFSQREHIQDIMKRNPDVVLPQTPLLLVDDVCTSGNSLLCAYKLLKPHPYPIQAFVLSAHPMFLQRYETK